MIDQNTDPTFSLLKQIVSARPGIKNQVKTASVGEDQRNRLPKTAFADPENRLFPVHTPEQAILSSAYAQKQANISPSVRDRISGALEVHGCKVAVSLPEEDATEKVASEEVYLLGRRKQFPIRGPEDVPQAASFFCKHAYKLNPEEASEAAALLVKTAGFGSSVPDLPIKVLQYAGLAKSDLGKAAEWIEARYEITEDKSYLKLASLLQKNATEREDLVKVASALGDLDELHKLNRHYGLRLPSPQETVFNTKEAMGPALDFGSKQVDLASLMKHAPESFSDILGDDLLGEISSEGQLDPEKLSTILPTLPMDLKNLLVSKLGL
jgi:hypothetical protein